MIKKQKQKNIKLISHLAFFDMLGKKMSKNVTEMCFSLSLSVCFTCSTSSTSPSRTTPLWTWACPWPRYSWWRLCCWASSCGPPCWSASPSPWSLSTCLASCGCGASAWTRCPWWTWSWWEKRQTPHPSATHDWLLCLTRLLRSAAELWHLGGVLQPHCASLFHQHEEEESGPSWGGPGSHGQLCKSHLYLRETHGSNATVAFR